jgi:Amt family ammonium transporter
MMLSWQERKPSVLGIVTGAVVGLVAITPAAGFVTPLAAIVIGGVASSISYYGIKLVKQRFGLDESLDVFACHGLGGLTGALATGLFATKTVNNAGADGLFYGNPAQLLIQLVAALAAIGMAFAVTFALAKLLNKAMGLRVNSNEEEVGLDISEHGERAYA